MTEASARQSLQLRAFDNEQLAAHITALLAHLKEAEAERCRRADVLDSVATNGDRPALTHRRGK